MKKYFIEIQVYNSGISKKGKELQTYAEQFHHTVAFSEKALEFIINGIERLAEVLDVEYPRSKSFSFKRTEVQSGNNLHVYMRPGIGAPTCFILYATEIKEFYGYVDVEFKRLFDENTEQHERER